MTSLHQKTNIQWVWFEKMCLVNYRFKKSNIDGIAKMMNWKYMTQQIRYQVENICLVLFIIVNWKIVQNHIRSDKKFQRQVRY